MSAAIPCCEGVRFSYGLKKQRKKEPLLILRIEKKVRDTDLISECSSNSNNENIMSSAAYSVGSSAKALKSKFYRDKYKI